MRTTLLAQFGLAMVLGTSSVAWSDPQTPQAAPVNESDRALASFKPIVKRYQSFLSTSPKVFCSFPHGDGYYYFTEQYVLSDLSYDIEKTNSLVSPFTAVIDAKVTTRGNEKAGDFKVSSDGLGWLSRDAAKAAMNNNATFGPRVTEPISIWFSFAYQDGEWVLKSVERADRGNRDREVSAALGLTHGNTTAENAHWKALLKK